MDARYSDMIATMQKFLLEEPTDGFVLLEESERICRYNGLGEYDIQKIADVANEFDDSGKVTLIYLASLCRNQINNTMMPVDYALTKSKSIDIYRKCLSCVQSEEVKTSRKEIVDNLAKAIGLVSGKKVIGDTSAIDSSLDGALNEIFKEFKKLKFEVYANSGKPIGNLTNTSVSVQVCGSLAECLLWLENSNDGIYICFISNPGTLDGWFGYFVKSNGNYFSYNERIEEAYVGQHGHCRNGRYAEYGKAYGLFPYELCEFSEKTDYKGYSTSMRIGDNRDLFSGDNLEVAIRVFLTMALISSKHRMATLNSKTVVVNSILNKNLAKIKQEDVKETDIVLWKDSQIVRATNSFQVPIFDEKRVIAGEYNKEFNVGEGKDSWATGIFCGANQEIVDAYGDGFRINQDEILASKSSMRLIGDGHTEQEFIGSSERLRLQAYYEVRKQLCKYIGGQMYKDYKDFGEEDGLREWYTERLKERMPKILSLCIETRHRLNGEAGDVKYGESEKPKNAPESDFVHEENPFTIYFNKDKHCYYTIISLSEFKAGEYLCPVTGKTASYHFRFCFRNYIQVKNFLGCDLPKFCVGWHEHHIYNGNPNLEVTDPIGNFNHPVREYPVFNFRIDLSKSGVKKLEKQKPSLHY